MTWYIERQYAAYGTLDGQVFRTGYALPRLLISWALSFGLRILGPPALVEEARNRVDELIESHRGEPPRVITGARRCRRRRSRSPTAAAAAATPPSARSASRGS